MSLPLHAQVESILLYKTEPVSYAWLSKICDVSEQNIRDAVVALRRSLDGHGIVIVEHDDRLLLVTHPEMGSFLEQLHKKDMSSELSRSALETLTLILYKDGTTKADLDYIRGVNSQFMIRNLLIRGLIEKKDNPQDKRRPLYIPSHDTLKYLGISSLDMLPERDELLEKIESLLSDQGVTKEDGDEINADESTEEEL